jgi:hypothetical protein
MKKAFLIVGPESSGTRALAKIFVESGCVGSYGHSQPFDDPWPSGTEENIVWRRSVPHDGLKEPDLDKMYSYLVSKDYDVCFLVTTRNIDCMASSQVKTWGYTREESLKNIYDSYIFIFSIIGNMKGNYYMVNYESLIQDEAYILRTLSELIGINLVIIGFSDENSKWINQGKNV